MLVLILWDSWKIVGESKEQGWVVYMRPEACGLRPQDLRYPLLFFFSVKKKSTQTQRYPPVASVPRSVALAVMALDPLSAFSVACNVLQIVETSLRVLGKTAECYKSGAPDEVSTLIGNLYTIEGLNDDLRDFIPDPLGKIPLSPTELRLVEANEECLRLSGDFIRLLESLKVTKKSVWHSIGSSIKTMWYQDKLANFEKAISESRANLTLAFLLLMHERSLVVQNSVIKATTDVEDRILDIVKKNTGSLKAEIGKLTSSLNEMSFDNRLNPMYEVSDVQQNQLAQLSKQIAQIWEQQIASEEASKPLEMSRNSVAAQHRVLQSLQFPQMQERKEEISSAYENTYEWLFQADQRGQNDWHSFVSWARRADNPQSIYWIHGKPGSGKSTLARFIYDRLNIQDHLCPWAESRTVLKAAHFFWSPGTTLQKSWIGMLRSLLFQLLDEVPALCELCVSPSRWRTAVLPGATFSEWTESELLHGIRAFVRTTEAYLFFLIDGLDEIQGDEERREDLIEFVLHLANYNNVKLCISSRPDNIFRDAFNDHPRLKLETLTYNDIQTYITERFARDRRIRMLSQGSPHIMNDLTRFLVDTAAGVFLWVRLVVHELLRAARDGSTFPELVHKAHQLPRDLDNYFSRFIDSIPPEYRREASLLFQIALHDENSFTALHGLRLLDLSYLGSFQEASLSRGPDNAIALDPDNIAELESMLESTARRINSRCRGLIECYYKPGDAEHFVGLPAIPAPNELCHDATPASPGHEQSTLRLLAACNHHVAFIHRSLRDFLVSPDVLQKLEAYSGGPLNARLFLCTARLAQIQSLNHEGDQRRAQLALGLSSYVLSALGTKDLKYSHESALIAAQLRPIVESLGRLRAHKAANQGWYLSTSFQDCQAEAPDFLGVAIDFDLVAYLKKELTAEAIRAKRGLSVLDCILIGRFSCFLHLDYDITCTIGNQYPNIEVLRLALNLGADPNEDCDGVSTWAEFIIHLDSLATKGAPPAEAQKAHAEAIRALLEHGADPELPSSCLPPGILIPKCDSDFISVVTVLRGMLGLYSHAQQELQECIDLADEKLMQALLQR